MSDVFSLVSASFRVDNISRHYLNYKNRLIQINIHYLVTQFHAFGVRYKGKYRDLECTVFSTWQRWQIT